MIDIHIKIVDFAPEHREHFRSLNEQWINEYFTLEEPDRRMLNDPQGYILDRGGYIFMAYCDDEIAGTCALIRGDNLTFELAKMAVAPAFKGRGIGYALGKHCIEKAKNSAMRKIELLSNTILTPAINLYKKLGFIEVPLPPSEYKRANIKMEIDLQAYVKASVIVADDLPTGLAINAASLVTATLGNRLKHLIGDDVTDYSGISHAGLTWLPIAILKADRHTLLTLREEAASLELTVVDVTEQAQMTRAYEDFSRLMKSTPPDTLSYLAVGLYGDKKKITTLTKKLMLYK